MPRPHIEFLKSAALPWQPTPAEWARPACETRLLSRDPDSGASTALVRYPAGWSADVSLASDEEIFVLEGTIDTDDRSYRVADYAYLPAGFAREHMRSSTGATVLTFFEPGAAEYDSAELVEKLATSRMPWVAPSDPTLEANRVGRKVLKPVARDGGRTWLLRINAEPAAPFEIMGVERHPCVEEMFLLDGDMSMTCGVMREGDYFWRPPMIPHGPMGTRRGFLGFFRAKEGSFSTEWTEPDGPIEWDAPYSPTLPSWPSMPRT